MIDISAYNAKTALMTLARMASSVLGYAAYAKPMNLAEAAKLLRIEPRVIIAPDCLNYTNISAVQQSLLSLYSACWLTAADVLFKVDNVRTIRMLDQLRPDRDATGFLLMGQADMRFESYRQEGYQFSLPHEGLRLRNERAGDVGDLQQFVNLSVGRQLELDICSQILDGKVVPNKVTINVRLKATSTDEEVISAIMTGGNIPRGWAERWRAVWAGEIEAVADGIFQLDIFREKMRLGVLDREGLQRQILSEANANKRYGILTKAPSLADASNMFVISKDFADRELRPRLGGNLSEAGARSKIWDMCAAMVIAEVDREKNRVRFYVRNEPDYASIKDSDLKDFKNKGPDVMELFAAIQTSSFNRF